MLLGIGTNEIAKLLTALLVFALVIFLCWLTTRWIAGYERKNIGKGNIEVVEARRLGTNKALEIVRIGDDFYCIGVGKDEVNLIAKLDKEKIKIETPENTTSFSDSFKKILDKAGDKINKKEAGKGVLEDEDENI